MKKPNTIFKNLSLDYKPGAIVLRRHGWEPQRYYSCTNMKAYEVEFAGI